ncbi:hypothetical protein FAZ78_08980 [Cereibacter changlensis]|uniref:Uncharacterized protein n=1 Tax=Cereibacter changlensis TaxID=402884 RepID=A0A4U0YYE2_9RHOB|nr:hypothetical protein [Cereibacter changlensis]TKA96895.1 hypothetical protein FAZ78_08980 [Cereibacter changlensis]
MPMIDINTPDWAEVQLAQDEVWQVRAGLVLTSVEPIVEDDQGIELPAGGSRTFRAGQTVRYRRAQSGRNRICREAL